MSAIKITHPTCNPI